MLKSLVKEAHPKAPPSLNAKLQSLASSGVEPGPSGEVSVAPATKGGKFVGAAEKEPLAAREMPIFVKREREL